MTIWDWITFVLSFVAVAGAVFGLLRVRRVSREMRLTFNKLRAELAAANSLLVAAHTRLAAHLAQNPEIKVDDPLGFLFFSIDAYFNPGRTVRCDSFPTEGQ